MRQDVTIVDEKLFATLLTRQGIYDKDGSVYAYELLYREPIQTAGEEFSDEEKTSLVMTQLFANMDADNIIGNKKAFIHFTYNHLIKKIPNLLPKERIVVEVMESVDIDKPLINSILELKEQGYKIALHDFIFNEKYSLLIELADIIKLNVLYQKKQQIEQQLELLKNFKGQLLAKKIEDNEQFADCVALGFTYFQGFFLNKPDQLKAQKITENKGLLLRLLGEFNNPNIAIETVAELILPIPKLSYRVLRLANSAYLYRGKKFDSLLDAIRVLGLDQIYSWLCLFLLSSQDDIIPDILERTLIRAKMCSVLAEITHYPEPQQAYMVGIFSTLDRFLNEPMQDLLSKTPLSEAIIEALLHRTGQLGTFLQVVMDYETANFKKLERSGFDRQVLTRSYFEGIQHANYVMDFINK